MKTFLILDLHEQIGLILRKVTSNSINIATDKVLFLSENCRYLSYFSMKTYVVGTH